MLWPSSRWAWFPILGVVVYMQANTSVAETHPVRLWGDFGYDYRTENVEDAKNHLDDEHIGRFRINAATFLFEPWIAQARGGLGLSIRETDFVSGQGSGEFLSGDLQLRLFPRSRFPFEMFVERTDRDDETDAVTQNVLLERYGFEQRYTSKAGGGLRLRYEHLRRFQIRTDDDQANDDEREDDAHLWQFGYHRRIEAHSFDANANLDDIERGERQRSIRRKFSSLRHRYRPGPTLSIENQLTFNNLDQFESLDSDKLDISTSSLQFNSHVFWRPRTLKRLLVNGTLRLYNFSTGARGETIDSYSTTTTLGINYQWSPRWLVFADLSATYMERNVDDGNSHFERVGADYTSIGRSLGRYRYNWFGSVEVNNLSDDEASVQSLEGELGHTIERTFNGRREATWRLDARQSAEAVTDTDGRSVQTLRHGVGVSWNKRKDTTYSFIRLSAHDTRVYGGGGRFGDEEREFQLINLQGSIDHRLSRHSSVRGSLTLQASRNSLPSRVVDDSVDDNFEPSTSVNITYFHRQVFGLPRLYFRSNLQLVSDSYLPVLDDPDDFSDRDTKIWENRLEYFIGRLQLRLIGRLSENKGLERSVWLFQLRRFFGDI